MNRTNAKAEIAPENNFGGSGFVYLRSKLPMFLLGAITVLSAVLCFHNIGARQFWYDEGVSLGMAELPWHDVIQAAPTQPNMWLYYLLLRGWLCIGRTEGFVRSLSALFAIATIPITYALVKQAFQSTKAGLIAALLLATNADFIKYAQETRSYTLQVLLLAGLCCVFIRTMKGSGCRTWLEYIVLSVMALYSHFFSLFVLFGHACQVLFMQSKYLTRRFIVAIICIGLLTLPLWRYVLNIPASTVTWVPRISTGSIYELFNQMSGNGGPLLVMLFVVGFLAGAMRVFRNSNESESSWAIMLWGAVPALLMILISTVRPMLVFRYFLMIVPAGLALVASGFARIRRSELLALVLIVWSALSLYGVEKYYRHDLAVFSESSKAVLFPDRENYLGLAKFIEREGRAGDAMAFYLPQMRILYSYYADRLQAGNGRPTVLYPGPNLSFRDITGEIGPTLTKKDQFQRIWLIEHKQAISNDDEMLPFFRHAFRCTHPYESKFEYPTWTILLYSRIPGQGGTAYHDESPWAKQPCHPPAVSSRER